MPCRDSDPSAELNYRDEIPRWPSVDDVRIEAAVSSVFLWLGCVVEVLIWVGGGVYLYWQIPVSVQAIRGEGVEAPRSMVRVIQITDWIHGHLLIALPLILGGVIGSKLIVFSWSRSRLARLTVVLAGWAIPVLMIVFGAGIPKMIQLGLWP